MGFLGIVPAVLTVAASPTPVPTAVPFAYVLGGTHGSHGGPHGGGGGGSTCTTTLPSANGVSYTPSQIKNAYSYSSANGAGETIAIIDAYGSPTLSSDLACFDTAFGLPTPSLKITEPWGAVKHKNSGWGLETSLDVEWAHAMAPAANILLIVTPSASFTYLVNDAVP